jgi:hypothetical protein
MGFDGVIDKLDSIEGGRSEAGEIHPETAQSHKAVRHDAFSASFVDGRARGVGKGHTHSALRGGYGCGQSGGATTDDKDV